MTLEEARDLIGRRVVYTPWPECPPSERESGTITSVGTVNVFVRYGADVGSKATDPRDLELEL